MYVIPFLSDNLKYIQEFKGIITANIGINIILQRAMVFLLFMKNSLKLDNQTSF
jgi:hypothetical protein